MSIRRRAVRLAARPLALVAIGVAVLAGCRPGAAAGAEAERVVGVSKQLNEFLYAIGAEDVLVARDLTSIYPAAITSLPSVGYHRALSAEGIIAARPTLLLTDGNVGPAPVLEQVRKVGIPVLVLGTGNTVDSAQQALAALGARFHRERAADSVLHAWTAGMARVRADSARLSRLPRPRVLVMHFGQIINGYLAVNRGGPADQMITWAGGTNAIDSVGGMTRLTPELIAKAAPDVIVATDVGFDRAGSAASFATLPGVALTPAAKAGRIYRIDETELIYFGPRTPATVQKLAAMFHP
ncbi:MAG TPA: ABC transporter substrate-binding protein [Gemmatimonadales bacterium]|nr:ABC transporter substrate-binding protein [Gemmatimonadales bacterium]